MKAFSASQAVWPAIERTGSYLFQPFAWETFLKLSAVAAITEGVLVNFKFSFPNALEFDTDAIDLSSIPHIPGFTFLATLATIAAFTVGLLIFHLAVQLRIAFFHCLVHQSRQIRLAWNLYPVQVDRFFKANVLVWLSFLVPVILVVVGVVVLAFTVLTLRTPDGKLDPGVFLMLYLPCIGFVFLVCIAALASEVIMHDFILPHMVIENLSFRQAWRAVRLLIRDEKETFLSYFILRLFIPFLAGAVLAFAASLLLLPVFWILGMSAAGFNSLLEDATGALQCLHIALEGVFVLLGLGIGFAVAACLGGPLAVFIRYYALLFYGSRYKPLGNLLQQSSPHCLANWEPY